MSILTYDKTFDPQAFLIAFTSDFIQKLVYKFEYGERGVMRGYVMFTLSKSPVKNWISRGQVGLPGARKELLEAPLTKCSNGFDSFTFLHRGSSLKYLSSSTPEPFTSIFTFQPKEIL